MQTQPEGPITLNEIDKKDLEFAKEFWTLGNVVTGFSILQGLAFVSSVGPHRSDLFCATFEHRFITALLVLFFSVGYFWMVNFCHLERERLLKAHAVLSKDLERALGNLQSKQRICIAGFLILSVAAIFGGTQEEYDKACMAKGTQYAATVGHAKP
ncbi:hypothetical protein AB4Y44_10050 [Paraburkholderia sp. BR10937]|uniref:hypothetical protein n=1 Tax=Paraburkholderia sp. BR10937 TaxID=3236994 RepID=UPI0034D32970